ncbi:hypothetical protein GIB67_036177 [Kingdonia uniflora]|uniref:Uncharacterized protein n=1 Tax=Kingdonia uniflora TaxID=39325 RepID=A0A7J7N998_9MAGN|nr:hypothetical protein GIB67_036177 [Kingdonia uniflora]
MQNQDEDLHPSTLPGFIVTRDPERAITRSRSGRKKKRIEFEDVQQPILNPSQENYPRRCITQLPEGVTHIYYTGKELTYWFYEYCGVGHPIVKEEVMFSTYPRLRAWERGNRKKVNNQATNMFMLDRYHIDHSTIETITWEPWAGIIPVVVTSTSLHSLSQDFSLPGEPEGPDSGWYMQWTGRREMLPIHRLRTSPSISSSYGTEELWHLTHGMRQLALAESARDAQRLQQLTDENVTLRRH